jgi:GNAT superfamily N-acetyltransferase
MRYEYNIPVSVFFKEGAGLLIEHWQTLANNPNEILLNPDIERYQSLQDAGILHNIVAYEEDNMVGYVVLLIMPHLHYKDDKFAMVDVLFTSPSARNSKLGITLINRTEELCKAEKVSVLTYHTKPAHNTIDKILFRKGFSHFENIIGKLLKE